MDAFRDDDVYLCTMHQDNERKENVFVLPFRGQAGYYLNALHLRKIVKKIQPDVINVHYASGYGTLARIAGLKKYILNVWGSDVFDFPYESKLKMNIIKKNLNNAFQIASTSEVMKEQVLKLIKPSREIVVTPFGVDTNIFVPSKKRSDNFIVGTIKTLSPKYGIDVLIRAFDYAVSLGMNNAQLIIVGGGEQRDELEKYARSLPSGEKITFIGPVEHADVPSWLTKFDLYVALSERESFGVAVVEAESCGVPVVVSNVGGLPEVVQDTVSGFIIPKGDWKCAGEKMFQLCNNVSLREKMGEAGRKLVLEKYDWNICVDIMEKLFKDAMMEIENAYPNP